LKVRNLDVETGASDIEVILSEELDFSKISLKSGVSSIKIVAPESLGVKLILNSGLSSKDIDDFEKVGENVYESRNFYDSSKTVEIKMDLGVSSLEIKRV
jgi:hypothetical protein